MTDLIEPRTVTRKHPHAHCEEVDYAYFAGLLDGEGWIGASKTPSGTIQPRIQIGMTDYEVLVWCKDHFGGSIHVMKSRLARRDAWKWNMSSEAIRTFLPHVIPYLKVKKSQAELALDWAQNWCGVRGVTAALELITKQEELWTSLKALKQSTP